MKIMNPLKFPIHLILVVYITVFVFFISACNSCTPQKQILSADALLGDKYYRLADSSYLDIPLCKKYSYLALPLLEKTEQWDKYIYTLCGLNSCYSQKEQFDSMEINGIFTFEEAKRLLSPEHYLYQVALNNFASVYKIKYEDNLKALQIYKEAYQLIGDNPSNITKAGLEENLGEMYSQLGDFNTSIDFYKGSIESWKKVIAFTKAKKKNPHIRLAQVQDELAQVYYSKKELKNAKTYSLKSIETLKRSDRYNQSIDIKINTNFAKTYIALGEYNIALNLLRPFLLLDDINHLQKEQVHHYIGLALSKLNRDSLGIIELNKGIIETENENNVKGKAAIHLTLSNVYHSQKKYLLALKHQQAAVQLLTEDLSLKNDLDTPNPNVVVSSKLELFKTLVAKGKTIHQLYQNTHDLKYLEANLKNYIYLSQLTDDIRSFYQSNESQLLLLDEAKDFYEAAVTTSFLLFEKNKNPKYLEQAFFFSEKSKSELLVEELRKKEFSGKGIIADSLLKKQYELKTTINYNRKILKKENLKTTDKSESKIRSLENTLFDLQKKLADLKDQIKLQYPTYAALTKLSPSSINEIQSNLSDNQILLEYFVGEKNIFLFKITSTEIDFIKLSENFDLNKSLTELFQKIKVTGNNGVAEYSKVAHDLYLDLLPPDQLVLDKKNLIIIPDGQLENLSFDILLTKNDATLSLRKQPYFVKDFLTSYAYSATIFSHQKNQNPIGEATILGLFPSFKNAERNLQNQNEIYQFMHRYAGIFFKDKNANKQNLLQHIKDHQVIHFSTHARGKDTIQNEPSIDLADGSLFLSDLQTYTFSAYLAVLSACETNVGTYKKGEGTMSLSRGCTFAGVPSIITSTSNVLDLETNKIIQSLYKNLAKKMPKHEALRLAKLEYLSNPDIPLSECTPYHWGTFLAIGNTDPITLKHAPQKNNWWYFLGIPAFLLLFFIFKKIKSS